MRTETYLEDGLQVQDYPNNRNVEVQVMHSIANSNHEVAGFDDASIISQLITTSQEVEDTANNSDKVSVVVMEIVDDISNAGEINQKSITESSLITDINSISDFSQPTVEMQTVEIENVSVLYQENLKERKDISDCKSSLEASSENVVSGLNETNGIIIEMIKEPDIVSDIGKENDSKSYNLSIEELDAYDLEEKIRLSTLVDLDEENNEEHISSDKPETLTNGSVESLAFGARGQTKNNEVKCRLQKVTVDKGSDKKDSKEDSRMQGTLNSSLKKRNKIPSMQEFKSMLETWAQKNKGKPVLISNVHYGPHLKPVVKPDDLCPFFFSVSNNAYFCSNCSLLFKKRASFIMHRFNTDGKCYYECDFCMKKYMVRNELNTHRKIHLNIKPYLCTICNQAFRRRNSLMLHIQQHHREKSNYSCFICGKLFKVRPSLLGHLQLAHKKEEEKILCSQCPKRFKSNSNLKAHEKLHTAERTFACDVCSKLFKTVNHMKQHRKTHFQERDNVCEICAKGFFKLEHLKKHRLLHTGLKPFACTICAYRCNQKSNLNKHMKIHAKHINENTDNENQRKRKRRKRKSKENKAHLIVNETL